jgi:predicted nucleic acid-binding protein
VTGSVLLDTGPLVAFLDRRDPFHCWAVARFDEVDTLLTCEAVVAEASHLLRRIADGPRTVLELLERDVFSVAFSLADEAASARTLVERYANVPMSLADACLVLMAERHTDSHVLTLDRDFLISRTPGGAAVSAIAPWN